MNKVIVFGLGYVGLPLAVTASKHGYKVTGFDTNTDKIYNLKNGVVDIAGITEIEIDILQKSGNLNFVDTLSKFTTPAIFVIAVPTPLDYKRDPDMTYLEAACIKISEVISDGSLVITESTSYIGTLTEFIQPLIEKLSNANHLHFAVAPERIDPGNNHWNLANTPRVIGGITSECAKLAIDFYSVFCDQVIQVSSPEVAEAAKLLENTFRQVNIALVNEIASFTKLINISMNEVVDAAATKPFGFMEFRPGIGVGGHCIPVDPVYLTYSGDKKNLSLDLVKLSNLKNQNQVKYIVNFIISYFKGEISGKRIQIVGITYKKNVPDMRESPAVDLMKNLRELGATVIWHDPLVEEYQGEKSEDLLLQIDLGLIITPHEQINFQIWSELNSKVLDFSAGKQILSFPKFF